MHTDPSSLVIRRAGASDFLAVAALDRVGWRRNRFPDFIPDGEHVWRVWCEHALTFVACEGENVVGVILAFPCVNGSYCLHKVIVDEAFRGRGIASQLFEVLLREVDAMGVDVFLTVDPANEKALRLYARWGFTDRTFVKGFYREEEDRFVLVRPSREQTKG